MALPLPGVPVPAGPIKKIIRVVAHTAVCPLAAQSIRTMANTPF
jgi:hypothetical protein